MNEQISMNASAAGEIAITNVTKTFGPVRSLDHVSATIKQGSIFGLIGSNGAGKSTLLRVMAGIYAPDEGSVTYDGEPVWENTKRKQDIVYLSDDQFFFPHGTIADMAAYYRTMYLNWSDEKYEKLRAVFNLETDRKISTFSKGMQKQASVLLALSCCPKYLLCDETFDGLDPVMRQFVKRLLICLAGLLGGMLFHVMSSGGWSIFWMLFGIVCGAFLAWMLCNTIFYKTPKMMFTGKRAVCIITAVMMVFSLGFRFDVLRFDNYVPSNSMTHSLMLDFGDAEMEIKDRALIRLFNATAKNGYQLYDQYGSAYVDEYQYYDADNGVPLPEAQMRQCSAVWKTRYLLPIAKITYAQYADWDAFVRALIAHEDFADMYMACAFDALKTAEIAKETDISTNVYIEKAVYPTTVNGVHGNCLLSTAQLRTILETYREEMRALGDKAVQQQCIGRIRIYFENGTVKFPLYNGYTKTRAALEACMDDYTDMTVSAVAEHTFLSATLNKKGEWSRDLSEAEFRTLCRENRIVNREMRYTNTPNKLLLLDPDYTVTVTYRAKGEDTNYYYEYYDWREGSATYGQSFAEPVLHESVYETDIYETTVTFDFFDGCVPDEYSVN